VKRVGIIGASGSIGNTTLRILKSFPDKLSLVFATVHNNVEAGTAICQEFDSLEGLVITSERRIEDSLNCKCYYGHKGLLDMLNEIDVDIVVFASPGSFLLDVFLFMLDKGITIASANKEVFTSAGALIGPFIKKGLIIPIDSEQNAIFQCLQTGEKRDVNRLILTCSGGPFLGKRRGQLKEVGIEQALAHPRWNMGRKVSLDSATLMNKALELIEASVLFEMPHKKIDVLVHPQAFVHSMVEFSDGNIIMQSGKTDMAIPIQYALSFPERWENPTNLLDKFPEKVEFFPVDEETFTSISTARLALDKAGSALVVFDYANEQLGKAFLEGKIGFLDIIDGVRQLVVEHVPVGINSLEDIESAKKWVDERLRRGL